MLGLLGGGDERASVLAHRMAVSRPTVTALVDSLFERGFVTREPDPDDRRAITVSLTAAGRTAVGDAGVALRATLDSVLERLSLIHI